MKTVVTWFPEQQQKTVKRPVLQKTYIPEEARSSLLLSPLSLCRRESVSTGNKVLQLALWSRKLALAQAWKTYTGLHNIAYLYLRRTLRPGSCKRQKLKGGRACALEWLCLRGGVWRECVLCAACSMCLQDGRRCRPGAVWQCSRGSGWDANTTLWLPPLALLAPDPICSCSAAAPTQNSTFCSV